MYGAPVLAVRTSYVEPSAGLGFPRVRGALLGRKVEVEATDAGLAPRVRPTPPHRESTDDAGIPTPHLNAPRAAEIDTAVTLRVVRQLEVELRDYALERVPQLADDIIAEALAPLVLNGPRSCLPSFGRRPTASRERDPRCILVEHPAAGGCRA